MKPVRWALLTLVLLSAPLTAQGQGRSAGFMDLLLTPKFLVMLIVGLVALFLLLARQMRKGVRVALLLVSTFLFGVAANLGGGFWSRFAMHPSPICAATKPFLYGLRIPFLVTLAVIFLLTLLGPKLYCSYVCPVGAVQELISMLADKLKIRRIKPSFRVTNRIRTGLFLVFLAVFVTGLATVTVQGRRYPDSLYNYINAFHGMELEWNPGLLDNLIHYLPFILTVILAFKLYRPFCHLVCPIGLYTHYLEHLALFKYRRRSPQPDFCAKCQACIHQSPCRAIDGIMKGALIHPDCFGCDRCAKICPEGFIGIKGNWGSSGQNSEGHPPTG